MPAPSVTPPAPPMWLSAWRRVADLRRPQLVMAAATAFLAEVAIHLLNYALLDGDVKFLNSTKEWSYSHVLGTLAFAGCTVATYLGARAASKRRAAWWTASGLFCFLFIDNVTRLHVYVGFWPLYYAPILGALIVAATALAAGTEQRWLLSAGLLLLVTSMAMHVFGIRFGRSVGWWHEKGWPFPLSYQVLIALKEGTELAGWVLVFPSLVRLAERTGATGWPGLRRR